NVVLFVNGIPVVVILCEDADSCDPIEKLYGSNPELIDKLENSELNRGVAGLFKYNQFIVSANNENAVAGTMCTDPNNYQEWKEIDPRLIKALGWESVRDELNNRELLIAGMLHPYNLIDIMKNFILFTMGNRITGKIISTSGQFQVVNNSIEWLMKMRGMRRLDASEQNRAKICLSRDTENNSTIAFLVQKIRSEKKLSDYRIVVAGRGSDLKIYLKEQVVIMDSDIRYAMTLEEMHRHLKDPNSNIIISNVKTEQNDVQDEFSKRDIQARLSTISFFSAVNGSEKIVVIVDEMRIENTEEQVEGIINSLPRSSVISFVEKSADIGIAGRGELIYSRMNG
ncbi:MAG: hypothetical protein ABIG42_08155, partial [bacterium]